jgi:hypothetical protein
MVRDVCAELHAVLPFKWMAIRFAPADAAVAELVDTIVAEGAVPQSDDASLRATIDRIIQAHDWSQMAGPRRLTAFGHDSALLFAAPITHDGRPVGAIVTGPKKGPDPDLTSYEIRLVRLAAGFLGQAYAQAARLAEQQAMLTGTLKALAAAIDAKDPYTFGHSERVAFLATMMAKTLGLSAETVEHYHMAGLLHDIGKIGVPEGVLLKPGKLTAEEFAEIRKHPEVGRRILDGIPALGPVLPGVLHHHEQWCGAGYPARLAGEAIPLIARVLALADAFDAMSSTRAYRCAMPRETVLNEVRKCSGRQFDPDLASVFLSLDFTEFDDLLARQLSTRTLAA